MHHIMYNLSSYISLDCYSCFFHKGHFSPAMISFLLIVYALSNSQRVYWSNNGKNKYLSYTFDSEMNRVPHFSYAGYKHGNYTSPLGSKVIKTLYPPKEDASTLIQTAIADASTLPLDVNGFRGTIFLKKGIWTLKKTVYINVSGLIIQGEGNGDDPATSTVLRITGDGNQYSAFTIGTPKVDWYAGNALQTKITTKFVGIASFKFQVESVSRFKVGQSILINYPANQAWLNSVNRGDTYSDSGWSLGFPSINYLRRIIYIDNVSNTLFIDAPTFDKMNSTISQPYVIVFDDSKIVKNVIVRDLRIQITSFTNDPEDQNHAQNGIVLDGTEDVWIYKCTVSGFVRSGIAIFTSTRVSVTKSASIDPIGIDDTNNFYNFCAERNSQLILFAHNFARGGRHQYIVNGMSSASGIVFFDSTSVDPSAVDESHRGWSNGILFDYMCTLYSFSNYYFWKLWFFGII